MFGTTVTNPSLMLGHVLLVLAGIAILHSAFSTYEHLSLLKALGRPEGPLPTEIISEALIGLLLGVLGASLYFDQILPLKGISWASEMKKRSIDEMDSRLGFASFVHRGNALTPPQDQTAMKRREVVSNS